MGAFGLRVWAEVRAGWRGLLGLALLVAVAGAVVLGSLAAAHRTATAYERMVDDTDAYDVLLNPDDDEAFAALKRHPEIVGELDGVEKAAWGEGVFALPPAPMKSLDDVYAFGAMASDGVLGYELGRPNILEGRMPDADAPDEALVNPTDAEKLGLEVGESFPIRLVSPREQRRLFAGGDLLAVVNEPDFGTPVDLEIVGIGVTPDDLVVDEGLEVPGFTMTPAFFEQHREPSAGWGGIVAKLEDGAAGVPALRREVEERLPDAAIVYQTQSATGEKVDRSVRPYVVALLVFGGVAALLGVLLVAQAAGRRLRASAADQVTLRAMGMTRPRRFAVLLALVVLAVSAGAAGAIAIATLVSPLAPIGPARSAEPHPGITFDSPVLLAGACVLLVLLAAACAVPAWLVAGTTHSTPSRGRARISSWLARAGAPVPATTGVRFGVDDVADRSRTTPARSIVVGSITAIALAAAVLTFGASLDDFTRTPRQYGADWNVEIQVDGDQPGAAERLPELPRALDANRDVEAFGFVYGSEIEADGHRLPALALEHTSKEIAPVITSGRAPTGEQEIALGAQTAADLGVGVGDVVPVRTFDGTDAEADVVGIAVLPGVGLYPGSDKTAAGEGALVAPAALGTVVRDFGPAFLAVRVVDDADPATVLADLPGSAEGILAPPEGVSRPSDVVSLTRLRATPDLLLGLLVVLLAAVVVHALVLAIRQRRRELAVLQALGYTPRQVIGTCTWQAAAIAVVATIVGIPLGVVLGEWAWTVLADALHVVSEPVVPAAALLVTCAAVLAIVVVAALVPGSLAARRSPSRALRAE
jgi:putative ABC transport system permease protein